MLHTLEVRIDDGPMTEEFVKRNPVVSRTIQSRSDQTLDQLHRVSSSERFKRARESREMLSE